MTWWEHLIPNRAILTRLAEKIDKMEIIMADVSNVLNEVAEGLRTLGPRVATLLVENDELRKRNAELEGEDVAESDAAAQVKSAYDDVVKAFDQTDEAPTPEPLPQTDPAAGMETPGESEQQG